MAADRTYEGPYAETELFLPDGTSRLVKKGAVAKDLPDEVVAGLDEQEWPKPGKSKSESKE